MRLLKKINRNYLISSAVVLFAGLAVFYVLINRIAAREILEGLHASETRIVHELKKNKNAPNLYPLIEVKMTEKTGSGYVKDTTIFDPVEKENEVFKELNTFRKINGRNYHIIIRALMVEKRDIVASLFVSIAIIFFLLIGTLYWINKRTFSRIWKPFNRNLALLKNFSLEKNENMALQKTGIAEFDALNDVVTRLTEKVSSDYRSLKAFTENASHEIQTPLAVMLINLEEILQQKLPEDVLKKVYGTYETARRLSVLNRNLILLTKIDNGQFAEEDVLLNNMVQKKAETFRPLAEKKHLRIEIETSGQCFVHMHEMLAETLVANLLSNAIRHNVEGGNIRIVITSDGFEICNTGDRESLPGKEIFQRFVKKNSQGMGLGLAIVKRICDRHGMKIDYTFSRGMHCFRVGKK